MTSCSRVDEEIETTETIPQPQEITSVSETEDTVSSETQTSIISSEQSPEPEPSEAETSAEALTSAVTEATETIGEIADEVLQARDIDIDLTQMSSTMVFSQVYNITMTPEDYQGKVIKMKGQFLSDLDTGINTRYYACLILDATASSAEGLGFEPKDG